MTARKRATLEDEPVAAEPERIGSYFLNTEREVSFIPSGGLLLDLALGGGWARSRILNIVGDRSTAKTGLAMEAMTNFTRTVPDEKAQFIEIESAFDKGYADAMGLPLERVEFPNDPDGKSDKPAIAAVEDLFEWFDDYLKNRKAAQPGFVVVDSLDALSDRSELDRGIDEGSYGANKAKKMSELFRRLNQRLARSNVTVMIISQTRDNIGVSFGRKWTRAGGRALDFYSSQTLVLAKLGNLTRTRHGITRSYGVAIRAQVDKNKVGMAFREAELRYIFGWGIDDTTSCLDWLVSVGKHEEVGLPKNKKDANAEITKLARTFTDYEPEFIDQVADITRRVWREVEEEFIPSRSKYA